MNPNYQQNTECLATLQYENNLLRERNKILQLENQTLLKQIQSTICSSDKNKENVTLNLQQSKKIEGKLLQLFQRLTEKIKTLFIKHYESKNSPFLALQRMIENQCSLHSIVQTLESIVDEQIEFGVKKDKSDLSQISENLKKRREAYKKRQRGKIEYMHIVKEPTWKKLSERKMQELQSDIVLRYCQKLVRVVKSSQTNNSKIAQYFNNIRNLCQIRKQMVRIGVEIKQNERQMELGIGCNLALEELSSHLIDTQKAYHSTIKTIQGMLIKMTNVQI